MVEEQKKAEDLEKKLQDLRILRNIAKIYLFDDLKDVLKAAAIPAGGCVAGYVAGRLFGFQTVELIGSGVLGAELAALMAYIDPMWGDNKLRKKHAEAIKRIPSDIGHYIGSMYAIYKAKKSEK
ncbi:hypothetical protein JXB28_06680 [Candidatus Woesearchaeota archaeon]|nr:hypothetical protein [Candidatus Woesearchaeota archaeon]